MCWHNPVYMRIVLTVGSLEVLWLKAACLCEVAANPLFPCLLSVFSFGVKKTLV